MKRTMALVAAVSMLALFALTSQASAQGDPTVSVDPAYVSEAGDHTVTVSGDGWQAPVAITACPGYGGVNPDTIDQGSAIANCPDLIADMSAPVPAPGGSFSTEKTFSVPAEGLVIMAFTPEPSASARTVVMVGEAMGDDMADDMDGDDMAEGDDMGDDMADDMGDDMAPMGGADTGLGGMAGSDGNSAAVPLAASLAAIALLGGTALLVRRHS